MLGATEENPKVTDGNENEQRLILLINMVFHWYRWVFLKKDNLLFGETYAKYHHASIPLWVVG